MKKGLLLATLLLGTASSAYATPCTVVATVGNVHFVTGSSDPQCNDGDDLKLFLDGVTNANSAGGSLGGNNNSPADSNITITSNGSGFAASTDANGFANFKSVIDNVDAYEATPNDGTTLPKSGDTFNGFDGSLFRGQLTDNPNTPNVHWNGDVTIVVDLSTPTGPVQIFHTFTGFKKDKDIGVIGFDEIGDPAGYSVTDYFAIAGNYDSVTGKPNPVGLGSWDEFKQIEMSVPGQIASIPEPSTWVMMVGGFGFLAAYATFYRRRAPSAVPA